MGYRSELVIKFSEDAAEALAAAKGMDPNLAELLEHNEHRHIGSGNVDCIYFSHTKWYEGYEDVDSMMSFLSQLNNEDYGFMRIGEDNDDIEELGTPWEYDIYISRSISW